LKRRGWSLVVLGAILGVALASGPAAATPQGLFKEVGFDQRLGATLPLDAGLRDAAGRSVRLGDYFGQRPVLLVLGYFECPNLCGVAWRGLLESLKPLAFEVGRDFDVVAVSIDPEEGPAVARRTREGYVKAYGRPGAEAGWHFLTGTADSVRRVADAVGFRYVYDEEIDEYAHAAGVVVATAGGVVSRYLFGVRYPRTDLRLSLVESSDGRIGSPVDQLLLLCYHYDPTTGQYGVLINNLLRGGGVLTVSALLGFVVLSRRRERRAEAQPPGANPP